MCRVGGYRPTIWRCHIILTELDFSLLIDVTCSDQETLTTHAIFTYFLCVLPMSVARSSSRMLMIGRIAYRREWGDGSSQHGQSAGNLRLPFLLRRSRFSVWSNYFTVWDIFPENVRIGSPILHSVSVLYRLCTSQWRWRRLIACSCKDEICHSASRDYIQPGYTELCPLSWLLVSFWAHVNIVHHIMSRKLIEPVKQFVITAAKLCIIV